jgi:hypothetical protein
VPADSDTASPANPSQLYESIHDPALAALLSPAKLLNTRFQGRPSAVTKGKKKKKKVPLAINGVIAILLSSSEIKPRR